MVMKKWEVYITVGTILLFIFGCQPRNSIESESTISKSKSWEEELYEQLPFLGHRNWILVVDKAFPLQTASGMEYINADEGLLQVFEKVLKQLENETHIRPIVYRDRELSYITEEQMPGIRNYQNQLDNLLIGKNVETLLHDSVFHQLDKASELFKIVVIKTNETLPYSSVFMELDCKYWDGDKEQELREILK